MKKTNYYVREQECEDKFRSLGNVYNANTPENHPLIFTKDDDFKAGMTAVWSILMSNYMLSNL